MNLKQIKTMWYGIGAVVATFFFPPWKWGGEIAGFRGFKFLLSRPDGGMRIDTTILLLEWLLISLVTLGVIVTIGAKQTEMTTLPD